MGLIFRRRIPLTRWLGLNLSKSGASLTARKGRVSVNSRGRVNIRLWKGFSIRLP